MKRVDAIIKMKGVIEETPPIKTGDELIYPWDINLDLNEFADEQIEEFYDKEATDEKAKQSR